MSNRQLTFNEFIDKEFDDVDVYCGVNKLSHYDISKISWNFCQAQEKREYELLESEHSELLANFCKVDIERIILSREVEELKLQNKKAINAFKALNRYLCDGEHVDLCWIKDEIQLQAESESLTKSRHSLEIVKYKREIDGLKIKFSEATKLYTDDIEELEKKVSELEKEGTSLFCKHEQENKALKKKLSEAVEVIVFYGNQENWYSHGKDSTVKRMIDLNDGEEFLNYEYGGRRARAFLRGNKDE